MSDENRRLLINESVKIADEARKALMLVREIKKEWANDDKLVRLLDELEEKLWDYEKLTREQRHIRVDFRLESMAMVLYRLLRQLWDFFTG